MSKSCGLEVANIIECFGALFASHSPRLVWRPEVFAGASRDLENQGVDDAVQLDLVNRAITDQFLLVIRENAVECSERSGRHIQLGWFMPVPPCSGS